MKKGKFKHKGFFVFVGITLLLGFLIGSAIDWYYPYYDAKTYWGVKVPLNAEVLRYDKQYDMGGMGHTHIVFDVSGLGDEMREIIKEYGFKKHNKDTLVFTYPLPNGWTRSRIVRNSVVREDLGLKSGYYYDKKFTSKKYIIVVYNPKKERLFFIHEGYR